MPSVADPACSGNPKAATIEMQWLIQLLLCVIKPLYNAKFLRQAWNYFLFRVPHTSGATDAGR